MTRSAYKTEQIEGIDGMRYEYEFMEPTEQALLTLMKDLSETHWSHIVFGPCIQGAVYEVRLIEPPKKLTVLDEYLTVDLGDWHFHLCIGTHSGIKTNPTSESLANIRRASTGVFFRSLGKTCAGGRWGFRMWNGADEQMLTVFLPNPYLSDQFKPQKPDWTRLKLWNDMRQKYLPGATAWVPGASCRMSCPPVTDEEERVQSRVSMAISPATGSAWPADAVWPAVADSIDDALADGRVISCADGR